MLEEEKEEKKTRDEIQYYECKAFGHKAIEYANRKNNFKSKAMNVTWDDDSDESNKESWRNEDETSYSIRTLTVITEPTNYVESSSDEEGDDNLPKAFNKLKTCKCKL